RSSALRPCRRPCYRRRGSREASCQRDRRAPPRRGSSSPVSRDGCERRYLRVRETYPCYAFRATSLCYVFVLRLRATSSCYVFVLRFRATSLCYVSVLRLFVVTGTYANTSSFP